MLSDPKQKGPTKEGKVRAESGGSLREAEAGGKDDTEVLLGVRVVLGEGRGEGGA